MKIYNDLEQGSLEWLKLRLGKVTGSRLKELLASDNLKLIDKLTAELITEEIKETRPSESMQRGTDMEPIARKYYEAYTGSLVEQVGFMVSEKYDWFGVSPDGLIKKGGIYKKGVEIKCPDTETHVRYIRMGGVPSEHRPQVLSYFIVNPNHEEHDFVSFDNRFKIRPIYIATVTRDSIKEEIEKTEEAMVKFWIKFQKYYNEITF